MVCWPVFVRARRICPEELKEAASSLLFAASRCGEFPELHELRGLLTSRYGKGFAASAIELRNNCAVNPLVCTFCYVLLSLFTGLITVQTCSCSRNFHLLLYDEQINCNRGTCHKLGHR